MVIIKALFKLILNTIPLLLMTIGRTDKYANSIHKFLGLNEESISIDSFMLICFIVGVLGIYIYYPIRYEILNRRIKKHKEKLKDVTKELRNIFCKNLGKEIKLHDLRLNIRKFEKRKFYRKPVKHWTRRNLIYFEANSYDFLNSEGKTEKFSFQVSPIQRGLIGVTYGKKNIMYDDKLSERMDEFNLNNNHKNNSVIANTDFAMLKPFLSSKGKVKSIIAFDTEQDVTIPNDKKKEVERLMLYYSDLFGKLLINLN